MRYKSATKNKEKHTKGDFRQVNYKAQDCEVTNAMQYRTVVHASLSR